MMKKFRGGDLISKLERNKKGFDGAFLISNLLWIFIAINYKIGWLWIVVAINILYYVYNLFNYYSINKKNRLAAIDLEQLYDEGHSFFNILNIISYFSRSDSNMARKVIIEFSNYLRGLNKVDREIVGIDEEINIMKSFVYIQHIRFNQEFDVSIENKDVKHVPSQLIVKLLKIAFRANILKQKESMSLVNMTSYDDLCKYEFVCENFSKDDISYEVFDSLFVKVFREELKLKYDANLTIEIDNDRARIFTCIKKTYLGDIDV